MWLLMVLYDRSSTESLNFFLLLVISVDVDDLCQEFQTAVDREPSRIFLYEIAFLQRVHLYIFFFVFLFIAWHKQQIVFPQLCTYYVFGVVKRDFIVFYVHFRVDPHDVSTWVSNEYLVVLQLEKEMVLTDLSFYLFQQNQLKHSVSDLVVLVRLFHQVHR